jgi:uncharacterized protein YegJ (DUF2314 family)
MNNWDKENLQSIDVSGKSYTEAIAIAKEHLDFFIKVFQAENTDFRFHINVKFQENEFIEHLWLQPVMFIEDKFVAIVDNIPNNLIKIKYQDVIDIDKKDVEDWIIKMNDNEVLGNFIYNSLEGK